MILRGKGLPIYLFQAWQNLMASMEWNKKEELVADQALKHLKAQSPLLAALAQQERSELALLLKIQEYCYENQNFLKVFQKIVVLMYNGEPQSDFFTLFSKWDLSSRKELPRRNYSYRQSV